MRVWLLEAASCPSGKSRCLLCDDEDEGTFDFTAGIKHDTLLIWTFLVIDWSQGACSRWFLNHLLISFQNPAQNIEITGQHIKKDQTDQDLVVTGGLNNYPQP